MPACCSLSRCSPPRRPRRCPAKLPRRQNGGIPHHPPNFGVTAINPFCCNILRLFLETENSPHSRTEPDSPGRRITPLSLLPQHEAGRAPGEIRPATGPPGTLCFVVGRESRTRTWTTVPALVPLGGPGLIEVRSVALELAIRRRPDLVGLRRFCSPVRWTCGRIARPPRRKAAGPVQEGA